MIYKAFNERDGNIFFQTFQLPEECVSKQISLNKSALMIGSGGGWGCTEGRGILLPNLSPES